MNKKQKFIYHSGSQTGETVTIKGQGYKNKKNERGDLIGKLEIVVPKKIDDQEKALFEKLKNISKFSPRKNH